MNVLYVLYSSARVFCPNLKAMGLLLTVSCKKKFLALVLFPNSRISLLKTLTFSNERKCYLPLEEALCFEQEKLTFRAAIWKVSHSGNLYKFSLYCPQKDRPSLDLWLSPCLTWVMFIWGKIAVLRIRGRTSHPSYQF